MNYKISNVSIVSVLLALFMPLISMADGMVIPPPDYWVYETGQEAAIFFDQSQETLILTTNFKGEVKNFGWIIPLPAKPDVSKGSDEILENLREIVAVRYRNVGYLEAPMTAGLEKDQSAVTVVETKKIDYLDLAVLTATDSQALSNWLKDNGYQYPQESSWILNDYISNGWYFVAVKVAPESQNAPDVVQGLAEGHITPLKIVFQAQTPVFPLRISGVEIQSQTVNLSDNLILTPAQISHLKKVGYSDLADKTSGPLIVSQIVSDLTSNVPYVNSAASHYPLIISAGNYLTITEGRRNPYASQMDIDIDWRVEQLIRDYFSRQVYDYNYGNQSMPINLYVITSNKVEATGFSQNYGNWIQKDVIKNLGVDFNGKPLLDPVGKKYFLTHLQRYMTPQEMAQMKTDLYLKSASDNKLVNAVELKGTTLRFWLTVGIGLTIFVVCVVVLIIWLKKPSKE